MIEIENVSRKYGSYTAVDGVSLRLRNGFFYGLTGELGCGKSTLLQMIAGCLMPTTGCVTVGGYDTRTNRREISRQIGYMPHDFAPCAQMTVHEFLEFVAELKGIHTESAIRQVNEVTVAVGLTEVRDNLMGSLPTVTVRRVGIAQALLGNPDNLLFDEPFAGLSPAEADELLALIVKYTAKKTVLLSDSDPARLQPVCSYIFKMDGGTLLENDGNAPASDEKEADV